MGEIKKSRFEYIDALRGYAILLVIFVHASQRIGGLKTYVYYIGDQGARGVQLFFVASAITLCFSWHRRHDGILAFYTRRVFRIAPMFWLAILYFVFSSGFGPRGLEPDGIGMTHIALTAIFLHGLMPSTFSSVVPGGWSIAVEMLFYLVFPILIATIKSWREAVFALALSFIPAIGLYLSLQLLSHDVEPQSWKIPYQVFSTLNFVHQLPVFLIGMTAYFIIRDEQFYIERRPFLLAWVSLFPIFIVLVAYYRFNLTWAEFGFHSGYALAFAGLAIVLARVPFGFLVNPVIGWIGKVSFSGYLWHLALIDVIPANFRYFSPLVNLVFFDFLLTIATIAASSITYLFVEKPMIDVGNKFLLLTSGAKFCLRKTVTETPSDVA